MRADARRNYERLLACAHEAFTERGVDASLEDIARRAGLGIGTLYRHFPTREALLAALLSERLRGLAAYAEEVLDDQEPAEAMANWIRAVCEHARTYRGIAIGVVMDDAGADAHAAGDRLLAKAQRAGVVRPDVTPAHIVALVQGLVLATEDDPSLLDVLQSVVVDGLSA